LKIKIIIVCTKTDKIGVTLRKKYQKNILNKLQLNESSVILTSSVSKLGIDKVVEIIDSCNLGE